MSDCPYCDDGELEDMEGYEFTKQCSNLGDCPAGFVFSSPCD